MTSLGGRVQSRRDFLRSLYLLHLPREPGPRISANTRRIAVPRRRGCRLGLPRERANAASRLSCRAFPKRAGLPAAPGWQQTCRK